MTYKIVINLSGEETKVFPFNYMDSVSAEFKKLKKNYPVIGSEEGMKEGYGIVQLLEIDGKEKWEKDSIITKN